MQHALDLAAAPAVVPGRKLTGTLTAVLLADGEGFRTRPVERLDVTLEGIPGDVHSGYSRASGSREPWYQRNTTIRSGRQLSIVSAEELAVVAERMEILRLEGAWIGANLIVEGVPNLSFLPPGTLLFCAGGATVVVEAQNGPCRFAGAEIAREYPEREGLDLAFPKMAKRLRGVVASVERAGGIVPGSVDIRLPEQWIWG